MDGGFDLPEANSCGKKGYPCPYIVNGGENTVDGDRLHGRIQGDAHVDNCVWLWQVVVCVCGEVKRERRCIYEGEGR